MIARPRHSELSLGDNPCVRSNIRGGRQATRNVPPRGPLWHERLAAERRTISPPQHGQHPRNQVICGRRGGQGGAVGCLPRKGEGEEALSRDS